MNEPMPEQPRAPREDMPPYRRETPQPLRPVGREAAPGFPERDLVHWAPAWAGMFVSLAIFLLLMPIGVAIGLSSGGWAYVWTLIILAVSFYVGGWVVGRTMSFQDGLLSAAHGLLSWALASTFLFALTLALTALSGLGLLAVVPSPYGGPTVMPYQVASASWGAFFALLVAGATSVWGAVAGNASPGYRAGP